MPWTATQVIDRSLPRPQQAPTCGCSGPPVLQRSPSCSCCFAPQRLKCGRNTAEVDVRFPVLVISVKAVSTSLCRGSHFPPCGRTYTNQRANKHDMFLFPLSSFPFSVGSKWKAAVEPSTATVCLCVCVRPCQTHTRARSQAHYTCTWISVGARWCVRVKCVAAEHQLSRFHRFCLCSLGPAPVLLRPRRGVTRRSL